MQSISHPMTTILVGTTGGCRVFIDGEEAPIELAGHQVFGLCPDDNGGTIAVVDGNEIWRRSKPGAWSRIVKTTETLLSLLTAHNTTFAGGMSEATMFRIAGGEVCRLEGFDATPGRAEWIAYSGEAAHRFRTESVR